MILQDREPIPVVVRSKARRSGAAGSNPTEGIDIRLLCLLCSRGLCNELITRSDDSTGCVCLSVI
jgi:hypothetical protein